MYISAARRRISISQSNEVNLRLDFSLHLANARRRISIPSHIVFKARKSVVEQGADRQRFT